MNTDTEKQNCQNSFESTSNIIKVLRQYPACLHSKGFVSYSPLSLISVKDLEKGLQCSHQSPFHCREIQLLTKRAEFSRTHYTVWFPKSPALLIK